MPTRQKSKVRFIIDAKTQICVLFYARCSQKPFNFQSFRRPSDQYCSGYEPIKFDSTQFERHFLHAFDVTGKCACVLKIETRGQNGIKSTDQQTGESNIGKIRYGVARSVYIACGLENGQAKTQH